MNYSLKCLEVAEPRSGGLSLARTQFLEHIWSVQRVGGGKGQGRDSREFCFLGNPSAEVMSKPLTGGSDILPCGWSRRLAHSTSYATQPTACLWLLPDYLLGVLPSWETKLLGLDN